MSQNYNSVLDQFLSLAKFGQTAYKSGERNQEQKGKTRKEIYNFVKKAKVEKISISEVIDEAREKLEDYIHDFGNPKALPDVFLDHLDNIKGYIKVVDNEADSGIVDVLVTLIERYRRISSKILRVSFVEKAPPMTLPSYSDLHIAKAEKKSPFDT